MPIFSISEVLVAAWYDANKAFLCHACLQIIQFDHAPPKGAGITEVKRSCPDYFLVSDTAPFHLFLAPHQRQERC
jgi:hypothetical protein